jgi:formate-dependent nitrite reductase membrane component NrfD
MGGFLKTAYAAVKAGILAYPGGTAAILGIVCAIVARFGVNVTVDELTAVAAVAAAVAGAFVHRTTVSKAKLPKDPGP